MLLLLPNEKLVTPRSILCISSVFLNSSVILLSVWTPLESHVSYPRIQHNDPARARTGYSLPEVQCANHYATTPLCLKYLRLYKRTCNYPVIVESNPGLWVTLVSLFLALWLVQETRTDLSTNQMQNKNQARRLGHPRFPALWTVWLFSLWVLIGSLWYFLSSDWLLW